MSARLAPLVPSAADLMALDPEELSDLKIAYRDSIRALQQRRGQRDITTSERIATGTALGHYERGVGAINDIVSARRSRADYIIVGQLIAAAKALRHDDSDENWGRFEAVVDELEVLRGT